MKNKKIFYIKLVAYFIDIYTTNQLGDIIMKKLILTSPCNNIYIFDVNKVHILN